MNSKSSARYERLGIFRRCNPLDTSAMRVAYSGLSRDKFFAIVSGCCIVFEKIISDLLLARLNSKIN